MFITIETSKARIGGNEYVISSEYHDGIVYVALNELDAIAKYENDRGVKVTSYDLIDGGVKTSHVFFNGGMSTALTLESINDIFAAAYSGGNGFEHNASNDAIVDALNAMGVDAHEVKEYTCTAEFIAHERGYHALRGLKKWAKANRRAATGAAKAAKASRARAPKAPQAKPQTAEPKAAEPKATEPQAEPKAKAEPKAPKAEPQTEPQTAEHEKLNACLNVIKVAKRPLLMTGAAGSGKSYMAARIAELCGADEFYTQSKVCFDTDLKGYMDAYGNYVPTALYRALKRADGGALTAYFLDEIFAGDTSCLTVINDLLSDGNMTFPNGEKLSAANLIIMAADNTSGNGATNSYNTRNKADRSFLNRFGCVHVDYDKNIEKKMSRGHADILEFVRAIRAAAERVDIDIVCSYRTIDSMAAYADAGINAAEAVDTFVYQDALTDDDKDTLRQDAKIARLIAKGNAYACAM